MQRVFIGLGSNLGDRATILQQAIQKLEERGVVVVAMSQVMETEPVGFRSDHPFLNQVIEVSDALGPQELLQLTQEIERELGRSRKSHQGLYSDRTCDLDLILYGDLVLKEAELEIPHPRFRERRFVLQPLAEIAPEVVDPVTGRQIKELLWDVL